MRHLVGVLHNEKSLPREATVSGVIGCIRERAFSLNFFIFVSGTENRVHALACRGGAEEEENKGLSEAERER